MKKILLGILLPVLTFVTLIGTGFAAWTFGDLKTTDNNSIATVTVSNFAEIGTLKVDNKATSITLDQPTDKVSGFDNVKLDKAITGSYTAPETHDHLAYTGTFKVTITISTELAKYIEVKTTAPIVADKQESKFTKTGDGVYTAVVTLEPTTSFDFTIAQEAFQYVSGKVPQNVGDYKAMVTALQGEDINIEFTATVNEQ